MPDSKQPWHQEPQGWGHCHASSVPPFQQQAMAKEAPPTHSKTEGTRVASVTDDHMATSNF